MAPRPEVRGSPGGQLGRGRPLEKSAGGRKKGGVKEQRGVSAAETTLREDGLSFGRNLMKSGFWRCRRNPSEKTDLPAKNDPKKGVSKKAICGQ